MTVDDNTQEPVIRKVYTRRVVYHNKEGQVCSYCNRVRHVGTANAESVLGICKHYHFVFLDTQEVVEPYTKEYMTAHYNFPVGVPPYIINDGVVQFITYTPEE